MLLFVSVCKMLHFCHSFFYYLVVFCYFMCCVNCEYSVATLGLFGVSFARLFAMLRRSCCLLLNLALVSVVHKVCAACVSE